MSEALGRQSLLEAARDYLSRGWSIIPIGGEKRPPAGFQYKQYFGRRASAVEVETWLARDDVVGVAIILGGVSGGLAVRDFDESAAYRRWAESHQELARTLPTVQTGRGFHVYFHGPSVKFRKLADGELRAGNNYVVAPPSAHPAGGAYRWLVDLPDGPLPTVDPVAEGLGVTEPCAVTDAISVGSAGSVTPRRGGSVTPDGSVTPWAYSSVTLDALLEQTQPEAPGQRESKLWLLARGLKFNVEGMSQDPRKHRPEVERWHGLALPVIGTKPFDDTWMDYLRAADRAKFPLGAIVPEDAMERARAEPVPGCARDLERPELRLLVALCREMQRQCGADAFGLSCHVAGRLIGVDPKQASRWLNGLERMGVVVCVKRAKPGPAGSKASRWRYLPPLES